MGTQVWGPVYMSNVVCDILDISSRRDDGAWQGWRPLHVRVFGQRRGGVCGVASAGIPLECTTKWSGRMRGRVYVPWRV